MKNKMYLLIQLTKKDIALRYKGSVLGLLWSFITPLLSLAVYTVVFSVVFQARWNLQTESKGMFALILFGGLLVINMENEILQRSVTLIASNVNYVKKVIFPLEILPIMVTLSALFTALISMVLLILANLFFQRTILATTWMLPLIFIPYVCMSIGISYIVSAISVYLKDMASFITILMMLLMYTSPVFYSLEMIPSQLVFVCKLNPLTYIIENVRNVSLLNTGMNWKYWLISFVIGGVLLLAGQKIFRRLREGFADVL